MAMTKGGTVAADPDAYVGGLEGWQRHIVEALRAGVKAAASLDERIKWTNLVYFLNGPVLMIRAEPERVLFGFWRGQRLRAIEPRLKAGGKYEMATLVLREGDSLEPDVIATLVREAVRLNAELGSPDRLRECV